LVAFHDGARRQPCLSGPWTILLCSLASVTDVLAPPRMVPHTTR